MTELTIRVATTDDLDALLAVSEERSASARENAKGWLESGVTRVVTQRGDVVGFAVTEPTFFGNDFVVMLQVAAGARRLGAATMLLRAISAHRSTPKVFTSTNLSNFPMQAVLRGLGWLSAGIVYGLDEADPEMFY